MIEAKNINVQIGDKKLVRDVSMQIEPGKFSVILGKNGAGKSTLLKILSKITSPTKGKIEIIGRLNALLEVGTGFHPELTGRENIFLNGTILGMSRSEIKKRFDEIVSFSGVEKFLDTPVKRYSSGMYVRLAFSVAAHLEPEIMVIDEVLAVGDVAFQKKCLGKMKDVSKEGRTVLFVSHNMNIIKTFCTKGILLNGGELKKQGTIDEAIHSYHELLSENTQITNENLKNRINRTSGKCRFNKFEILDSNKKPNKIFQPKDDIILSLSITVFEEIESLGIYLSILSALDMNIVTTYKKPLTEGKLKKGGKS